MSQQLTSYRKRVRNPSPLNFSERNSRNDEPARKIRNVTSAADRAELERHYTFVPSDNKSTNNNNNTWQERMVSHYHSHLYKEYVLADLTRAPAMLGLRWRTRHEVENGRGHATCGNKHCPDTSQVLETSPAIESLLTRYYQSAIPLKEEEERRLLDKLPYNIGLHDYEVPFTYTEQGETKTELVKLRLCLKCSPLLFKQGALEARKARSGKQNNDDEEAHGKQPFDAQEAKRHDTDSHNDNDSLQETGKRKQTDSQDSSDEEQRKRRRKHKKKKKHRRR